MFKWRRRPGRGDDTGSIAELTEAALLQYLRELGYTARSIMLGAGNNRSGYLVYWIAVITDREKSELAHLDLEAQMRGMLLEAGYPPEEAARACLAIESDETVNRDYGGNWWYAIK